MLRIGITGGIGSGKSTVCNIFEFLGVPVFRADLEAKKLYETNAVLREQIVANFGSSLYKGSTLNRAALGAIVFKNAEKLQLLNSLVHPLVFDAYENWCLGKTQFVYTIKEAAIMFESGSYKHVHFVVGVIADPETRVQRVMQRDGLSRDEILRRIENQMPQETLISRCDFIIKNDQNESLISQVLELHKKITELEKTNPAPSLKS